MDSVTEYLDRAEQRLAEGRFKQALQALADAHQAAEESGNGIDDNDLGRRIRAAMREVRNETSSALDTMFADPENLDIDEAQDLVNRYTDAILDEDNDLVLQSYNRRLLNIREERQQRAVFARIQQEVQALWDQAAREAAEGVASRIVIDIYTRARDVAQEAASQNPGNARLEALADEANSRRERASAEEAAMLSGAQGEQFERVLEFIAQTPDNETVMVYDLSGNEMGRMSKGDARAEIEAQARQYVDGKLKQYMQEANAQLARGFPLAAQQKLDQRKKFDPLFDLVTDLISGALDNQWRTAEGEVSKAADSLSEAERIARDAQTQAQRDAYAGWQEYHRALDTYIGARHSEVLKGAQQVIREALQTSLDNLIAEVDQLFKDGRLAEAQNRAEQLVARYEPVAEDMPITDRLTELRRIGDNARERDLLIRNAQNDVAEIMRLVEAGDPLTARERLRDLERRTPPDILDLVPEYEDLVSEVNLRVDKQGELDRLERILSSRDATRIQRALERATEIVEDPESDLPEDVQAQFGQLVLDFNAVLMLLKIDNVVKRKGYDAAIKQLEAALNESGVSESLRQQLEDKLAEVQTGAASIGADQKRLAEAEDHLKHNRAQQAYEILQEIEHFASINDRYHRDDLSKRAVKVWSRQLRDKLDAAKITDEKINLDDLQTAFDHLEEIDPDRAKRYMRRVQTLKIVQRVRKAKIEGAIDDALADLGEVSRDDVNAEELSSIRQLRNELSRLRFEQRKDMLIADLRSAISQETINDQLISLIELRNDMKKQAVEAQNRGDDLGQIAFMTWEIDLMLAHGEFVAEASQRRTHFENARGSAATLQNKVNKASDQAYGGAVELEQKQAVLKQAKATIKAAQAAPEIAKAMDLVETALTAEADFDQFREAVYKWQEALQKAREQEKTEENRAEENKVVFPGLSRRYDDRVTAVRQQLRGLISSSQAGQDDEFATTPENLGYHAKLLVLDEQDPLGLRMLERLPQTAERLNRDVNALEADTFGDNAAWISGCTSGSGDPLQAQLDRLLDQVRYIKLIRQVVEQFQGLEVFESKSKKLLGTVEKLLGILEKAQRDLQAFKEQVDNYISYLNTFNLKYDEENTWQLYEDALDNRSEQLKNALKDIRPGLESHPYLDECLQAKRQQVEIRLGALVDTLVAIIEKFEQEDFSEVTTLSQNVDREFFENMDIYDGLQVRNAKDGALIHSWEAIIAYARQMVGPLDMIMAWAQPFEVPDDLQGNTPNNEVQPSSRVLNWTVEKQIIDQLIKTAEFDEAAEHINSVLRGEGKTGNNDTKLPLYTALEKAARPPVATGGSGIDTDDYDYAVKMAGTERGKQILRWVEQHRYILYQKQCAEAEALLKNIEMYKNNWADWKETLPNLIREMREILDNRHGLFKRLSDRQKRNLGRYLDQAQDILNKMNKIGPDSNDYEIFEHHPTLEEARNILS